MAADAPPGDRTLCGRMMTSISAGHTFGNRVRMLDLVRRKPRSPRQDPLTDKTRSGRFRKSIFKSYINIEPRCAAYADAGGGIHDMYVVVYVGNYQTM